MPIGIIQSFIIRLIRIIWNVHRSEICRWVSIRRRSWCGSEVCQWSSLVDVIQVAILVVNIRAGPKGGVGVWR